MPALKYWDGAAWQIIGAAPPADSPGCRLRMSADVALANPGGKISWDTEDYDSDGFHSAGAPTRLTAPWSGYFIITATVGWATNTSGVRNIELTLNGVGGKAGNAIPPSTADSTRNSVSWLTYLNVGEYVEVDAYHASGAARTIQANYSHFAIHALRGPMGPPNTVIALPTVRAWTNPNQSVAAGATYVPGFATEDADTDGFHDTVTNNSRFIIPNGLGGHYDLKAFVRIAVATGGLCTYGIRDASTNWHIQNDLPPSTVRGNAAGDTYLSAGTQMEFFFWNNTGAAVTVAEAKLSLTRIRP